MHLAHVEGHTPFSPSPQQSCPSAEFLWDKVRGIWRRRNDALVSIEHEGKIYVGNRRIVPGAVVEVHKGFRLLAFTPESCLGSRTMD
jgi:hypothetical protein